MLKHRITPRSAMRLGLLALTSTGIAACSPSLDPPLVEPRYSGVFLDITGPNPTRPSFHYDNAQCVPYARLVSGIDLYGDAFTWWDGANGRYQRGTLPAPGAVLVLAQSDRLRSGHLAVVSQVINSREILVSHANWIPGQVIQNQAVFDASPHNDWTMLRFYNIEHQVYGGIYPANGFIYNVAAKGSVPPLVSALDP